MAVFFLQARESFVITTGIDTKLGSAPKSKVDISRTSDREVFFSENMPEGSGAFFWVPLKSLLEFHWFLGEITTLSGLTYQSCRLTRSVLVW